MNKKLIEIPTENYSLVKEVNMGSSNNRTIEKESSSIVLNENVLNLKSKGKKNKTRKNSKTSDKSSEQSEMNSVVNEVIDSIDSLNKQESVDKEETSRSIQYNESENDKNNIEEEPYFRFEDVSDDLIDEENQKQQKQPLDNKEILKSIKEVEERLLHREQINLTVMTIEVTNLVAAHRFTKNSPWLKGVYGNTYSWVVDYEESETGDTAIWKNMRWSFNLERNEVDRNDFIVTVCSKNLIIGRYVLDRTEFADIPNTKSGYFEVTGEIKSSLGITGAIRILFLKSKAERPKGPQRNHTNTTDGITLPSSSSIAVSQVATPLKLAMLMNNKLFVKIISIAVMDLKAVHFLDINCPFVTVEVGDWVGVSDAIHNAGMAAKWNSLNWKFIITPDIGFQLIIHSKTVQIGKLYMSLDELTSIQAKPNGTIEVIKHIVNGKELTGKVKIKLIVNHPNDETNSEYVHDTATAINTNYNLTTMLDKNGNIIAPKTDQLLPLHPPNHPNLSSPCISTQSASIGDNGDFLLMKPFLSIPFIIKINELTVFDSINAHLLRKNSLTVNIVCGSWGKATEELRNCGSYGHWINLNWRVVVNSGNNFRVTVWSNNKSIGTAALSIEDLRSMPTDFDNNTEIFTKIYNDKKEIVAKIRVSCKYENVIITDDNVSAANDSRSNNHSSPIFIPNINTNNGINAIDLKEVNQLLASNSLHNNNNNNNNNSPQSALFHHNVLHENVHDFTLPALVNISAIHLYDMSSFHTLKKNSPQIKLICDRKSIHSEPRYKAGTLAKWDDLNWFIKLREDTYLLLILLSNGIECGKVELNPISLINIPINSKGITEVKTLIKSSNNSTTVAKLQINMKFTSPDEEDGHHHHHQQQESKHDQQLPNIAYDAIQYNQPNEYNNPGHIASSISYTPPQDILNNDRRIISRDIESIPENDHGEYYVGMHNSQYQSPYPIQSPYSANNNVYHNNRSFSPNTSSYLPKDSYNHMIQQQHITNNASYSPPTNIIFDSNQVLAESERHKGLFFNLTLQEIDLINLKNVHIITKNSPLVNIACGKHTFISKVLKNTGDVAYWTKLNWKMTFQTGTNMHILVNSNNKFIGSIDFTSKQLINAISDDRGLRRVISNLSNDLHEQTGRVKLAYTLDVLQKPTLSQIIRDRPNTRDDLLYNKSLIKNNLEINPEILFHQQSSSLLDHFPLGYNNDNNNTSVENTSDTSYLNHNEDGLDLIYPNPGDNIEFPFIITIIEMYAFDLQSIHYLKPNQPVIKVLCDSFYDTTTPILENVEIAYYHDLNWLFPVSKKSICKITVSSKSKDIGELILDLDVLRTIVYDSEGHREITLSLRGGSNKKEITGQLRMIYKLSNSDTITYEHGDHIKLTTTIPKEPFIATTSSNNNSILGGRSSIISGRSSKQFVHKDDISNSIMHSSIMESNSIGSNHLNHSIISKNQPNAYQNRRIAHNTINNSFPILENDNQQSAIQSSSSAYIPGSMMMSIEDPMHSNYHPPNYKEFEHILDSQLSVNSSPLENMEQVYLTIQSITAIDLLSIHMFAVNSPSITIACGKKLFILPVLEGAGNLAMWENLEYKMLMGKLTKLRLSITSKDTVIGFISFPRSDLISGRKNSKGIQVLFGELEGKNKKSTGKIKLVYKFDEN